MLINGSLQGLPNSILDKLPENLRARSGVFGPLPDDDKIEPKVQFKTDQQLNLAKSRERGVPIFDTITLCEIEIDKQYTATKRVTQDGEGRNLPARFPARWKQFEERAAGKVGTPIGAVAEPNLAATLTFLGVATVEQLLNTPDANLGAYEGAIEAKRKAESFGKRDVQLDQAQAEIARLKAQLEAQKANDVPNSTTDSAGRLPESELSSPSSTSRKLGK